MSWAPKDLRNALPTFAVTKGIHGFLWEQYVGHSPKGVTDRHYIPRLASVSWGEIEALDRQMDLFRTHVIEPIDREIEPNRGADILNSFEQEGFEREEAEGSASVDVSGTASTSTESFDEEQPMARRELESEPRAARAEVPKRGTYFW